MTVKELMQDEVFTVRPDDPVDRAFFLIHYEKVRHLPVVQKNKVVGIVSDRDLYKTLGPKRGHGPVMKSGDGPGLEVIPRQVRHIMRRGVVTTAPEDPVTKAAAIMSRRKIGALPVVEAGRLVGIITATDLLAALAKMDLSTVVVPEPAQETGSRTG